MTGTTARRSDVEMAELLIETYGPVQAFEKTSGQYVARCTAAGCGWKLTLWSKPTLLSLAGDHEAAWH